MSKEQFFAEAAKFGQHKPSKDWAYALLERANLIKLRRLHDVNVTPAAIKIAEEAVRLDQFARVKEVENGEV